MNKPVIPDNRPITVEFEKGNEYVFCACDGSHVGTDFKYELASVPFGFQ